MTLQKNHYQTPKPEGELPLAVRVALAVIVGMLVTFPTGRAKAQPSFTLRGRIQIDSAGAGVQPDPGRAIVFLDVHPNLRRQHPNRSRPQIAQKNSTFHPDLLVIATGSTVEFPNWDPYSHNVFSRSRAAQFDLDRYPEGVSKSYTFNNVGLVQLFCNIHPRMRAAILVVPNRHFARADSQGRFELRGVPPGQYSLVAWHESAGSRRQTVMAGPGSTRETVVTLASQRVQVDRAERRRRRRGAGVERGLGTRRERLNLPVVGESHSAPRS